LQQRGDETAHNYIINIGQLRAEYNRLLLQGTAAISRKSTSAIINESIEHYTY
ncbi:hypothetical protein BGZ79_004354, partial [Entomortierella chlamydospora]